MTYHRMQHRRKLLIITYPFPPIPYSGSYRILRLTKGLVELGVEVHVLTINIDDRVPNDFSLMSRVPEAAKVHRIPIIDPWLRFRAWQERNKGKKSFRYTNRIFSLLMRFLTIPDHQNFWILSASRRACRIIRQHDIKTVFVTSPPNSSQLVGYLVKRREDVRWIADFRDPIVGNIAATHLIEPQDIFSKIESRVLNAIENRVIRGMDVGVANTETHRGQLKEKFKIDKVLTIRNSYDEDDYRGIPGKKFSEFTIAHLGSMYGLRNPTTLFKAVKKLSESPASHHLRLKVLFVGLTDPSILGLAGRYGIERYVEVRPMVPHDKAIEIMMMSHLLLLVKATGEGSLGQIPAKFFEYLRTGNRILFIGPGESEVARLILKLNCGHVPENESEMFAILKNDYQSYLDGNLHPISNPAIEEFSHKRMAEKVASLLS